MHENDEKCMLQHLKDSLVERDKLDKSRSASPLRAAEDAHIIDTTLMDAEELLSEAINIIEGKV